MSALVAMLAGALAAAQPPAPESWILSCDIPRAGASATERTAPRVFRLGPGRFQEWKANLGKFGTNLCTAYSCAADRGRLTGTLTSASVILTLTVNPAAGSGEWKTTGAANLPRTQGSCTVKPDTGSAKAGA